MPALASCKCATVLRFWVTQIVTLADADGHIVTLAGRLAHGVARVGSWHASCMVHSEPATVAGNWRLAMNTECYTWFERDRQHVELRDDDTDQTIIEWWDDDVTQAVDDGFLDPRDWEGSALAYARDMGVLA